MAIPSANKKSSDNNPPIPPLFLKLNVYRLKDYSILFHSKHLTGFPFLAVAIALIGADSVLVYKYSETCKEQKSIANVVKQYAVCSNAVS